MRDDKKKLLYVVIGLLVVAGVIWLLAGQKYGMNQSPTATSGTGAKPGQAMPQSYLDALAAYQGKRIQFDMYCQAIPTSLVYKNGVSLMLDNRSGDARTIKIGANSYSLAGYGWRIVKLSVPTSQLPATLNINCGSAVNVSKVLLQK